MRIAITGSTGFIGGWLLRELSRRGASLTAMVRSGYQPGAEVPSGVDWVEGRLGQSDAEARLVAGADAVVHLAGLTKARSRDDFFAVNADGARSLARAAHEAGCDRFVLASSLAAKQPDLSDYAASKRAGEEAVAGVLSGRLTYTIVRIPAVFGPDDPATRPLLDIMRSGWLPAPGGAAGRDGKFSLIFVTDLARALADVIFNGISEDIYAPYGERVVTWRSLADAAGEALERPVRVIRIPTTMLKMFGAAADLGSKLTAQASVFGSGKVREMLHTDWTGDHEVAGSMKISRALRMAFGVDASALNGQIGGAQELMK